MIFPYKPRPEKVSADSLPLPKGASTEATQQSLLSSLNAITKPGDVQTITAASLDEIAIDTDNLAAIKTDVDKLPTDPAREGGNLFSIKTDLDEIALDTDNLTSINTQVARLPVPVSGLDSGLTYGVASLAACSATVPSLLDGQLSVPSITPDGRIRVNLDDEPTGTWGADDDEDDMWASDQDSFNFDVANF